MGYLDPFTSNPPAANTVQSSSYTNTGASESTVEGASFTGNAADDVTLAGVSFTGNAASEKVYGDAFPLPVVTAASLAGLTLEQYDSEGSLQNTYAIQSNAASDGGGVLDITVDKDWSPWEGTANFGTSWRVEISGRVLVFKDTSLGNVGTPYTGEFQVLGYRPEANSTASPAMTASAPSAKSLTAASFTGTGAAGNQVEGATFTQADPSDRSVPASGFSNTAATAIVLPGVQSPTGTVTPPTQPTTVTHSTTLQDTQNYRVNVGTRSAGATIDLPDPGGINQWIEIIDVSLQADSFPIQVNPGTKTIDGVSGTKTLDKAGQVLEIYYTSSGWKIL